MGHGSNGLTAIDRWPINYAAWFYPTLDTSPQRGEIVFNVLRNYLTTFIVIEGYRNYI